jgi:phosphotransferase system HPr (HPr) family protein
MAEEAAYSRDVVIHFPDGLHVRPATLIAQEARKYQAEVFMAYQDRRASARNVFDMLVLGAEKGKQVKLEASDGEDAREAVEALAKLFSPEQAELFVSGNGDEPS